MMIQYKHPGLYLNPMRPFEWAMGEIGVEEMPGEDTNPRILWYHSFTELKATQDEVPWCSSFVCAAAEICGFVSTRSAAAISWVDYGERSDGNKGEIAIFKRPGGHHVAFVVGPSAGGSGIFCLGGNQGNKVSIKTYDLSDLITFRRFVS